VAEPLVLAEADEGAMSAAIVALDSGGLVVFPTDTVFGVGARPEDPSATAAVFEAKSRPRDLTLPVLVSSIGDARAIAMLDERASSLAGRFWPGGLTLVLPRTEFSWGWNLGANRETVAVRMPDHPVALDLLRRSGPLATTSANRSGKATPRDCDGVRSALGDSVALYLCAGPRPAGTASTVVDLTGGEPRVLREGALAAADVLGAL
jgi:tRNA threonylcarbamoyl adenosine modification protein (Sua5/YciO/YrdC/YwlC family)